MLELVIVGCMAAHPHICQNFKLTYGENITPYACMMGAMPQIAKWNEGHSEWTVRKFTCQRPRYVRL
jgi:hypothetical protein